MIHSAKLRTILRKTIQLMFAPLILPDYFNFKKKDTEGKFSLRFRDFYPQVKDKTLKTGFDRHYVYHTSWAARKVHQIAPQKHVDISSSLFFSGIVSAFVPVDFYDYRPADLKLSNLKSAHADLLALPFADNSIESLSCMHTIEHIGLGRYGDPIDPTGHEKAIRELIRVTAHGGYLIFVVPLGKEAVIEFNAHRIFTYGMVRELFEKLELVEFSLIPEYDSPLIEHATEGDIKNEHFACGCFLFKKPNA